ncbi:protein SPA1-RELATED 4 [Cocos nucifera]|uniref:Protein SPA1-RELATED 4 n=1 Tax=Cocos nucifera TaxID=13894 RepID=A0A8K0IAJ8_COCNU|nr:protein SPA1-RELATED 4 [Cocos nucifera]
MEGNAEVSEPLESSMEATHLKRKENDQSPQQPDSHNALQTAAPVVSQEVVWPEGFSLLHSPEMFLETIAGKNLSYGTASQSGSEPLWASPRSSNDPGVVVEELTLKNYKNPNLSIGDSSVSGEKPLVRKDLWQNFRSLAGGLSDVAPKESLTMGHQEDAGKIIVSPLRVRRPPPCTQLDPNNSKFSEHLAESDNQMASSNALTRSPYGIWTKVLSAPGFPQVLVKNSLKAKGVTYRYQGTYQASGMMIQSQNIERPSGNVEIVSNSSHRPSAKADGMVLFAGCSGRVSNSHDDGISLREWLKPKHEKINKIVRLHIFKQILELVDSSHAQGLALRHLRPSYFIIMPSNQVKYIGSFVPQDQMEQLSGSASQDIHPLENHLKRKVYLERNKEAHEILLSKYQKLNEHHGTSTQHHVYPLTAGLKGGDHGGEVDVIISRETNAMCDFRKQVGFGESYDTCNLSYSPSKPNSRTQQSISEILKLEERWYASLEEPNDSICPFSSNIYSLGVLLFEIIKKPEIYPLVRKRQKSLKVQECVSRERKCPRDVLLCDLISEGRDLSSLDHSTAAVDEKDAEADLLLHFLLSLKEQKEKRTAKLEADLGCLKADVEEAERRHLSRADFVSNGKDLLHNISDISDMYPCKERVSVGDISRMSGSSIYQERLMRNMDQLESAYFSMRSRVEMLETHAPTRSDIDVLKIRDKCYGFENGTDLSTESTDCLGAFFDGLCKYARHNKFEVRGSLKNVDILNSANVICSLSFDRDEEYFAAAGLYNSAHTNSSVLWMVTVVYGFNFHPNCFVARLCNLIDMGGMQLWDASTGQGFAQFIEHQKRAWSVNFSQVDPTKLASGSDDCSVKLWSINEACFLNQSHTQELDNFQGIPWCTLSGHGKAVSYVKFLDAETLVSASTDNTLKLWDLNRTNTGGLSNGACTLTFSGHTNEKNFVGLSVSDGYIACGSETNEVYAYYKTFPMPITSHKFGSVDPITGQETSDDNGQFVSSVCWRGRSNMVIAANSSGSIKGDLTLKILLDENFVCSSISAGMVTRFQTIYALQEVWYTGSAHALGVLLTATTPCQSFFEKNEPLVNVMGFKTTAISQSETCPDVLRLGFIAIVGIRLSELIRKPRPQLSCCGFTVFPFWCCPEE